MSKIRKASMARRMTAMVIAGISSGSVWSQNCRQGSRRPRSAAS